MPKKVVANMPPEEVEPMEDSHPTEISVLFRVVSVEPDTRQYMQRSKVFTHPNLLVAVKVPTSELISYTDDAIIITPAGFKIATDQLEGIYSAKAEKTEVSSDWDNEFSEPEQPKTEPSKGEKWAQESKSDDSFAFDDWDTEEETTTDTKDESDDGFGDFDFGDDEVPF